MSDFFFRISSNIILGTYATSRLGEYALDTAQKFMVVMDSKLREMGATEKITKPLDENKIEYFIFDAPPECACTKTVEQALTLARNSHVQAIIGAGGAYALNIAKIVAQVFGENRSLYDFTEGALASCPPLPLICVPATFSNPYLFAPFAPLVDSRNNFTKIIKSKASICRLVLFDSNFAKNLDFATRTTKALSILCLATEAYLSPKASFFSDMLSQKSAEPAGRALNKVDLIEETAAPEELLFQSGCLASLAAATSSAGAATLLALSANSKFKLSRSLVTSILFPFIIEDHAKFKQSRVANLAKFFRAAAQNSSAEEACTAFAKNIRQKIAEAKIATNLKDLKISFENFATIAEDASKLEMANFLPKSMTSDDLFALIKTAY